VDKLLDAADRMADWISQRHYSAHDLVTGELDIDDPPDKCAGCVAMQDYRRFRDAARQVRK